MRTSIHRSLLALTTVIALAACDDGTGPDDQPVTVQGSVEETTPAPEGEPGPSAAPGTDAETVAVVEIGADGELSILAEADVEADASYSVDDVSSTAGEMAVVAHVGTREAGRVLLHESAMADAVIEAAPINYETTAETEAWTRMKASGSAGATSRGEVALLLHLEGSEAEAMLASDAELDALAEGVATAGETLTAVYAEVGAGLDAEARADVMTDAAIEFSEARNGGASLAEAHDAFAEAALDGVVDAGVSWSETVAATAAAATTLDAVAEGEIESRGLAVSEAVRLNLRSRARLADEVSATAYADLADGISSAWLGVSASIRAAASAVAIGDALAGARVATRELMSTAAVALLAADASLSVQADVADAAEAAFDAARIDSRLDTAADATAAAEAMAGYRADVLAEVEAMIEVSGSADADAEAFVDLFIAGAGGPHIR